MGFNSPIANLLVIRSANLDRAVIFYEAIGLNFLRHSHGNGPEHYVSEMSGFVFEIYPESNPQAKTINTRIGFRVVDVDQIVELLYAMKVEILTRPVNTEWGRRAVVRDFDGHVVELITPS